MNPQITFDCFPGGLRKALTLSYDDGTVHDQRLVEILNRYDIKATFNLNSGALDQAGHVRSEEVAGLYTGHEVAAHTVTHPCLPHLARERAVQELVEDRRSLEQLVGYPVRGFAYPGGDFNESIAALLPELGFDYGRTVIHQSAFSVSDDFYHWPISCGFGDAMERADAFLNLPPLWGRQVLHLMGHSIEFEQANGWRACEEFCRLLGGRDDIWYATNIQIVDYLRAVQRVRASVDGALLYNPSGLTVWFSDWSREAGCFGSIGPGEVVNVTIK